MFNNSRRSASRKSESSSSNATASNSTKFDRSIVIYYAIIFIAFVIVMIMVWFDLEKPSGLLVSDRAVAQNVVEQGTLPSLELLQNKHITSVYDGDGKEISLFDYNYRTNFSDYVLFMSIWRMPLAGTTTDSTPKSSVDLPNDAIYTDVTLSSYYLCLEGQLYSCSLDGEVRIVQ